MLRDRRGGSPKPRVVPAPTAPPAGGIHAELELLGKARAALEAGDFARTLALVQRYDREIPEGTMREEIAMLRVGALCEVGPKARWLAARARFDREFPGSPLAAHLREDCSP